MSERTREPDAPIPHSRRSSSAAAVAQLLSEPDHTAIIDIATPEAAANDSGDTRFDLSIKDFTGEDADFEAVPVAIAHAETEPHLEIGSHPDFRPGTPYLRFMKDMGHFGVLLHFNRGEEVNGEALFMFYDGKEVYPCMINPYNHRSPDGSFSHPLLRVNQDGDEAHQPISNIAVELLADEHGQCIGQIISFDVLHEGEKFRKTLCYAPNTRHLYEYSSASNTWCDLGPLKT